MRIQDIARQPGATQFRGPTYNLEKGQIYANRRLNRHLGRALRAAALVELETDGWIDHDHPATVVETVMFVR
ncbi:hypothetical protein ACG83_31160 [Frankia sp. R43]|uniref:hypothetical protein n=1 Tax=Frankia sp. R43 TaxID=269536 RepID=UPI0006CA5A71|nr:hypothetical protein [Frankia sp. R43]KPM52017.1 hypothetical protein ACG83_31160 [Frankia sp. R43]